MSEYHYKPEHFKRFSSQTIRSWFRIMFGGGLTVGAICKTADIISRINTDKVFKGEFSMNLGNAVQYFDELKSAISTGDITITHLPEVAARSLPVLLIIPIGAGLLAIARRTKKNSN